jgi:hypothetical protein
VRIDLNGREVGTADAGPAPERVVVAVGRDALFRGDNLVGLDGGPGVRLHRVSVRPANLPEPD